MFDIYIKIIHMKKVIRLTEKELNDIVYNTTRQILNEGAGANILRGIFDIGSGLTGLLGGKKLADFEERHPKLTKVLKIAGMTPEADKIEKRKNNFRQQMLKIVTDKYSVAIEKACKDFNDELIEMISGQTGSHNRFIEIDDQDDAIPVSSEFYNECVEIINTNCDFFNKWSYNQSHKLVKSKYMPRTRKRSVAEREADKRRTRDVFEARVSSLDLKFDTLKRCVANCYNDIKTNCSSSRYLDQSMVYDIVSEYAKDFNYVAQMYYKLKYDWLMRTANS